MLGLLRAALLLQREQPIKGLPRQTPQAEALDPADALAGGKQLQIRLHKGRLIAGPELHPALQGIGQGQLLKLQCLKPHRQEQLAGGRIGIEGGGHRLEATIQQRPIAGTCGALQLSPGLISCALQPAQGPEAGAIAQAKPRQGAIKATEIQGRRFRRQRRQELRGIGGSPAAAAMAAPTRRAFAVEFQCFAEHQLHRGELWRQPQGLIQVQLRQRQGLVPLGQGLQGEHDETRRGEDHLAADAVIQDMLG